METKQHKADLARNRLLTAAEGLFLRGGPDAITIRGVTEAAGMSIAMVNYHFGSRAALLEAMLERRLAELSRGRALRLQGLLRCASSEAETVGVEEVVRSFLEETFAYHWPGGTLLELARGLKLSHGSNLLHARETFLGLEGPGSRSLTTLLSLVLPSTPDRRWRWRLAMGVVEVAIELWNGEESEIEELTERLTAMLVPMLLGIEAVSEACKAAGRSTGRTPVAGTGCPRPRDTSRTRLDPTLLGERNHRWTD